MRNLPRKYRPRTLDEVIGQEVVVQTLKNAIQNNALHPAYLFVGQFGSGKTTMSRILAAMENCLDSPGLYPCGKCDVCKKVIEGVHTDIEEVDAASSAGKVEQIRELKKNAMYSPIIVKTKYFIIDECHRMSAESNDALLRLLEEPPGHCRFVLCTTDINKLRPAIQSRCQRHDFAKIYWTKIADHLELICKKEQINADRAALNLCAKMSDGSMRNALQHLDKLIDFVGSNIISLENAHQMFGTVDYLQYFDLFDQIIGNDDGKADATEGFRLINSMLSHGADFASLYNGIADHLRNLMVAMTSSSAGEFIFLSQEGKKRLSEQLRRIKSRGQLDPILESIRKLNIARIAVEHNLSPETAFEQWFLESVFAFRKN